MRLLILLACLVCVAYPLKHRAPVLDLPENVEKYRGSIREDQRSLTISPEIKIVKKSGPVCLYKLETDVSDQVIPFVFEITDKETGQVTVKVKDGAKIDCKNQVYKFSISAKRCDSEISSESIPVEITVEDTNDHAPEFEQPWYTAEVDEGRLYTNIITLHATDNDCGHPYGEICRYEITNTLKDVSFAISKNGELRNNRPLNFTESHTHILSVVAHDCGMRRSKPTLVTIKVQETCNFGLKAVTDRVDYYPGAGSKFLAEQAGLNMCEADCQVEKAEAVFTLRTEHIARGCDRDGFASKEQRESCGADPTTVDLLPRPEEIPEAEVKKSENDVTIDSEKEHDMDEVYMFDGEKNAILIPPETTKAILPDQFTLSFWMKHENTPKEHLHKRENIICSSDDHKMNRHHFAVYIRNCKMEMLIRREHGSPDENKFRPAEWRWHLDKVCDGNWHHYTLSVQFPKVEFYLDGRLFTDHDGSPEILDDWPMHKTSQLKTRLVVGACWHGRSTRMAQFFRGYLSSMLYLPGKTEKPGVLQCLHQCKEQLQFNGLEKLVPGEQAIFNNEMSELTLRANKPEDFVKLLRRVAYVNLRHYPTPGHRGFNINAKLSCKDKANPLQLPEVKGFIFVQKAPEPKLTISGDPTTTYTRSHLKQGALMLPNLKIKVTQPDGDGLDHDTTVKHKLDWCQIHMKPNRNTDVEYYSSPAALIGSLHLDFEHDKEGIMLKGIEKVKGYQAVMDQIHYFNLHPEKYPKRMYTVKCSMLNGRVQSNELALNMVINPDPKPANTPETKKEEKKEPEVIEPDHHRPEQLNSRRLHDVLEMDLPRPKAILHRAGYQTGQASMAGGAVAIVVVVCVGLLLVLLIVGVLRLRGPTGRRYRKANDGTGDLQWDDSGMNIIVNPLEETGVDSEAAAVINETDFSDEDSSEDGDGFHDADELTDDDESDPEAEEVLPHVTATSRGGSTGLEWDDSTLNPGLHTSRTYRV